ncbi:unnamed protein product [[Candida] boidinii]|uniref:Unnamed protein product n=1 Tax=Candida boidinii TaxID=5477 RepID=A0ACB5TXN1_CANBO|nr:unnamed protein product [[Candida] boidinii]GMF11254.1 unnamed protein product [[Candida] boidinii]
MLDFPRLNNLEGHLLEDSVLSVICTVTPETIIRKRRQHGKPAWESSVGRYIFPGEFTISPAESTVQQQKSTDSRAK